MATGDYCSADELKEELWPQGSTPDSADDSILANIITAVSRWIDHYTKTRFYTTATAESRYYTAASSHKVFTDDIISVTSLKTDDDGDRVYENTWDTDDYDLMPFNASLDGDPYRWVEVAPLSDYSFPRVRKGVEITGKFGWCVDSDEPEQVKRACIIQAIRVFKRKDAPFGVISNPLGGDMKLVQALDPDVEQMLRPYKRYL